MNSRGWGDWPPIHANKTDMKPILPFAVVRCYETSKTSIVKDKLPKQDIVVHTVPRPEGWEDFNKWIHYLRSRRECS